MEQRMRIALTEVNCILENSEEEVLTKIPNKFKEYLNANMDREFTPNFIPGLAIFAQPISMEAKELLKLVYRDFLATEDERKILIQKEEKILNTNAEHEQKEKIQTAQVNVFEKKEEEPKENEPIENLQLIKVEEKWYKKLFRRLKNLVNGTKL